MINSQWLYLAVHPPSTNSPLPVTNDAASDARNTTTPASSCGSPQRPIGICATNSLYFTGSSSSVRLSSVPNGPGQIAFTVTPVPAHSSASTFVRLTTPAFDDAYGVRPGIATKLRIDPMLITRPHPRATIPGPNARAQRNGPL